MRLSAKASLELARLDQAAAGAGCALACVHQTAEEFHGALVRKYRALHARRMPFGAIALVAALSLAFVLI
jgi:hypothetical protein